MRFSTFLLPAAVNLFQTEWKRGTARHSRLTKSQESESLSPAGPSKAANDGGEIGPRCRPARKLNTGSGSVLSFCFAFKMSLIMGKLPRTIELGGQFDG